MLTFYDTSELLFYIYVYYISAYMFAQFKLWRHIRREGKLDMLISLALPNETVRRRHSM